MLTNVPTPRTETKSTPVPRNCTHVSLEVLSNELLRLMAGYIFDDVRASFGGEGRQSSF
jgi:hypothetical protein